MRSPCTATKSSPRSPQLEKAHAQQQGTSAAKNKLIKLKMVSQLPGREWTGRLGDCWETGHPVGEEEEQGRM